MGQKWLITTALGEPTENVTVK